MAYFNGIIFLLQTILFTKIQSLKIFEFSNSLKENTSVTIKNDSPTPKDFTLCLDVYNRLDSRRRILSSRGSKDIEIQVTESAERIYIQVAGIWYLALPEDYYVNLVKWETICISYSSEDQVLTVAHKNKIILSEKQVYPNRQLSDNFLKSLTLGEKDDRFKYVGDITRVNIWSKVLNKETLKNITNCGSSYYEDLPDILNWDNVEVTVEGGIIERDVEEYPCTSSSNNIHDVLMPVTAKTMYEAINNCEALGGKLQFPPTEEEVTPFMKNVNSMLPKSECKEYIWSNYYKNTYADNNWTVYESPSTYQYPPFQYPQWLKFSVGQPNGREHEACAGMSLDPDEPNLLYDLDCETKGYCYVCRSYN